LELRERLAIPADRQEQFLSRLLADFPSVQAMLLSTCNRVELYIARPPHGEPRLSRAIDWLAAQSKWPTEDLLPLVYTHEGEQANRHLFRVASSLDSLVVGESQILGQVKSALESAQQAGAAGPFLRSLLDRAFTAAKEVRSQSNINEGRASVGSVAVEFARRIFSSLADKTILMIGAGKLGRITLRHLLDQGARKVLVANRTYSKAESIAREFGQEAVPYESLRKHLAAADIVVTSTSSTEPILVRQDFDEVITKRKYRPMLIIDIAVPRNVDPAIGKCKNVYLYNIDDLESVVAETLSKRTDELGVCESIVDRHVAEFAAWTGARAVGPTIKVFRGHLTEIADGELRWLDGKLGELDSQNRRLVEQCVHRVIQKVLHDPSARLADKARNGDAEVYARTLIDLFGLPNHLDEGNGALKTTDDPAHGGERHPS
jgi:glutamyl-tRNA reductase